MRHWRGFNLQILESQEHSAALEQSSFGILSAETLAEASALASVGGTTLGASFAGFQNITAATASSIKTDDPAAVFKVPAARKSRKEANPNSLLKFAVDKNMKGSTAADWKEAPSKRLPPCNAKGPNLDLISAETLSDASKIVNEVMGDSFRSEAPSFFREKDSAVFKVPGLPPARAAAPGASVSCSSIGGGESALPTRFMTDDVDMSAAGRALPPGMLDTFMSAATDDASVANRSSFAWEKVVDNDVSKSASVDPERPVGDETFDAMNATGNSFCTGQFSARSTSFGGSNEGSSGRNSSRTRDEKFSDYTDASKIFAQESKSGPDVGGCRLAGGGAGFSESASLPSLLVNGPEGFVDFQQDFGEEEFGEEEFQTDGALDRIDAAEKEFEEHNKLQIGQCVEGACSDGNMTGISSFSHTNFSFKPPSDASTDFLSRSAYFMQNTSKLGYLDTTGRPELRPDLGMGVLRSPETKRSAKTASSQNSTFRVGSKNETYTLSSAESTLEQEKIVAGEAGDDGTKNLDDRELGAKLSSFADLDAHSLRDLIAKASLTMDRDPAFYAKLIGDFHAGKARPAEAEVQNHTLNATSLSPFLPSFLETTCDVDITVVEEDEAKKPDLKKAEAKKVEVNKAEVKVAEVPKPLAAKPKSRIPRLSPAASKLPVPQPPQQQQSPMVTTAKKRLPFAQLQQQQPLTAAAAKKRIRGQRFSSPIKDADAERAKGGPRAPTPKAAAVAGPAKKNLFSPQVPGKENQGTQVPTPTLTPSGGARRQPLTGENKRSAAKPAGAGGSAARGRPREGVYLDKTEVFFPMAKAGKSSDGEIVVKNRTKCSVGFKCSKPGNPFDLRYEKFAVKPGSYLKLPVKYCPVSSGEHVATVELISEGKDKLKVTLRGRCI